MFRRLLQQRRRRRLLLLQPICLPEVVALQQQQQQRRRRRRYSIQQMALIGTCVIFFFNLIVRLPQQMLQNRRRITKKEPQYSTRSSSQQHSSSATTVRKRNSNHSDSRNEPFPMSNSNYHDNKNDNAPLFLLPQIAKGSPQRRDDDCANDIRLNEYRKKINATHTRAVQCSHRLQQQQQQQQQRQLQNGIFDMQKVSECLHLTSSSVSSIQLPPPPLEYPIDAYEHYNDIRTALAPYSQQSSDHTVHTAKQYSGPWIENIWITHYESLLDDTDNNDKCLHDYFGPFIPIFIPWVDHLLAIDKQNHQRRKHYYPKGLVETLTSVLRPNVPYITISQNDEGIVGKYEFNATTLFPNLLVVSAGGYGHVPIPLIKQEEPYIHDRIPISERTFDISYVGSLRNAPHGMRRRMHEILLQHNTTTTTSLSSTNSSSSIFRYEYYYGPEWREIVQNSKYSLVPRGYGRSAYHMMEILQMGYIPIYIYTDVPWIPYMDTIYHDIGFMSHIDHLYELLHYLRNNVTNKELQRREAKIVSLRETHYTMSSIIQNQIQNFMTPTVSSSSSSSTNIHRNDEDETNATTVVTKNNNRNNNNRFKSDLQCQLVPSSLTGK